MLLIPAIDIIDGKCVRLTNGDYDKSIVYSLNPSDTAKMWCDYGVKRIHVVDLDGAKKGNLINIKTIEDIRKICKCEIEVGGGIRNIETAEMLFNLGIDYIIIGTVATNNDKLVYDLVSKYKERLIVGIDSKDGYVLTKGWFENSNVRDIDLAKEMKKIGAKTIIYTDIKRDGMLKGSNIDRNKKMIDTGINVITSGGISSVRELKKLKSLGAYGAIVGKAIYTNMIDLEIALGVI